MRFIRWILSLRIVTKSTLDRVAYLERVAGVRVYVHTQRLPSIYDDDTRYPVVSLVDMTAEGAYLAAKYSGFDVQTPLSLNGTRVIFGFQTDCASS